VLDTGEFLAQADLVLAERLKMLDHEVERFNRVGGATFFYFSTTDLVAHMLFKYMDEGHPGYDPEGAKRWGGKLAEIYQEMDRILGETVAKLPADTRVVVMSDHGFKSFRRQVSLNTWLFENGFLFLRRPDRQGKGEWFNNVDLKKTKAFALGFSGIYLNRAACPDPEATKEAIIRGLLDLKDPKGGARAVKAVYRREDVYEGPAAEEALDLVVGFDLYYGCTEASVLGTVPRDLFSDTEDAWSGSHLMDPSVVPGILLVNRPIEVDDPELIDLTKSILSEFGLDAPDLTGRRIWKGKEPR
jgi:predicted AlkP superfamily phosphohydrolase/phosphomutase